VEIVALSSLKTGVIEYHYSRSLIHQLLGHHLSLVNGKTADQLQRGTSLPTILKSPPSHQTPNRKSETMTSNAFVSADAQARKSSRTAARNQPLNSSRAHVPLVAFPSHTFDVPESQGQPKYFLHPQLQWRYSWTRHHTCSRF